MSKNQKETAAAKVEYIRTHFSEVVEKRINPFTNYKVVSEIKKALYDCGLYSSKYDPTSANVDAAVINLILKAQGKSRIKRPYVGRSRIHKETL